MGLKMSRTMMNADNVRQIILRTDILEMVDNYNYQGQNIRLGRDNIILLLK